MRLVVSGMVSGSEVVASSLVLGFSATVKECVWKGKSKLKVKGWSEGGRGEGGRGEGGREGGGRDGAMKGGRTPARRVRLTSMYCLTRCIVFCLCSFINCLRLSSSLFATTSFCEKTHTGTVDRIQGNGSNTNGPFVQQTEQRNSHLC